MFTDDVNTLLDTKVTSNNRDLAAINIINRYSLPLTSREILTVFEFARRSLESLNIFGLDIMYEMLFNYLLNNNTDMFIALIKAYISNNKHQYNYYYLSTFITISHTKPHKVGLTHLISHKNGIMCYKELLDYNDFCIDDLDLPHASKLVIQEYRSRKYDGRLTKAAIN